MQAPQFTPALLGLGCPAYVGFCILYPPSPLLTLLRSESTPQSPSVLLCLDWRSINSLLTPDPPPCSLLLPKFGRFSIPIGAPQHGFGTLHFHSVLLQHSTSHLALLLSLVAGYLFHPTISYCLSNPTLDLQLANISLHLYYISQIEPNDIGIQFQPLARYQ